MRWLRLLAALAVLLTLAASPTGALASCNPGRPVQDFAGFAGTQGTSSLVQAADADLDEYHPYVSSGSESLMWVMLNNGGTRWAQVGWWQDVTTHYVFEQHTDNSGHWFTNFRPGEVTALTGYRVLKTAAGPSDLRWNFYVRGSLWLSVARSWSPAGYQFYGETHRKADQMAGGYTDFNTKAVIYSPQYLNSAGTWVNVTTAAGVNNTSWYGAQYRSSYGYYIWDKACPS